MNTLNRTRRAGLLAGLAIVLTLFLAAACSSAAPSEENTVSTPAALAGTATARAATARAATAAAPTVAPAIPPPATLTPVPAADTDPATAAPAPAEPTTAPTAEPTVGPPTATPDASAVLESVEQAEYAASDCSDKYPCNDDVEGWEARLRVPEGFKAEYFAIVEGTNPNVITFGPDGSLYVATMQGDIWKIDPDGKQVEKYFSGLLSPAGLAFLPDSNRLYVSSRVVDLNEGGEAQVAFIEDGVLTQVIGGLPCCYTFYHSANGIAFGPDGYGYVGVGARADHGEILSGPNAGQQDELHPLEASILRFSPDGTEVEVYARGLRNPYDIAWDGDGRLFASDNDPDFGPPEIFHLVEPGGEHGYPWYDCAGCFPKPDDVEIVPPVQTFVPHAAPTGVTTYLDDEWPGMYNSVFLALWSAFPGAQKIVRMAPGGEQATDFLTGLAAPIDMTVGPDGNLYVVDWATGIIYRVSYVGEE